ATVYTRRMRLLLGLAAILVVGRAAAEHPHVYLVVVDGLDARLATPERMPRLFDLAVRDAERTSVFAAAHAVMPTQTNPNHVSLLTGVYPSAHGITGNSYWRRVPEAPAEKLDQAAFIEVETLFTVAEETSPELETAGVFAKPKLAQLFAGVPGHQRAPDVLWSPEQTSPAGRDAATGYSFDTATIGALLAMAADREPDLAVVNLADGGIEHVYADGVSADATDAGDAQGRLARVAEVARGAPGVAEVLARLPVPDVPMLASVHADWHLAHPRSGDVLLVAAPGHQFVDPFDPVLAGML